MFRGWAGVASLVSECPHSILSDVGEGPPKRWLKAAALPRLHLSFWSRPSVFWTEAVPEVLAKHRGGSAEVG